MSRKNRKAAFSFTLLAAGMLCLFMSCQKGDGPDTKGTTSLKLYLTDAPGDYKAVWIDIQKIMVNVSSDTSDEGGWIEAPLVHAGRYNLLDFRNGRDTLLAGADIPSGKLSQIRLVLGDDNELELGDGTLIPLKTPSAQESGIKLNVHADLAPGIPYALVLDFDAARSVVTAGNSGNYILKPVIRTFARAAGGAIEGVVLPDSAKAHVMAVMSQDTAGAIPDSTGYYKFSGMSAGTYRLFFIADSASAFQNDTIDNIRVVNGTVTKVDTVLLQQ